MHRMKKMNKSPKSPPALAKKLLKSFQRYDEEFNIISTLEDLYNDKCETHSKRWADLWYLRQVVCSIPKNYYSESLWRFVMFKNYMKINMRNIKKQKTYSFINITGLSIGLTAVILILLYVQFETSFDA